MSVPGRLLLDDGGCLRLREDTTSSTITPIWPTGYSVQRAEGVLVVLTDARETVGVVGERVTLPGGFASDKGYEALECGPPEGTAALEVNG